MIEISRQQRKNIGFDHVMGLMEPASVFGREALKEFQPFSPEESEALSATLDQVEKTISAFPAFEHEYTKLEHLLSRLRDIRSSIGRLGSDTLTDVDFFEMKSMLLIFEEIGPVFSAINGSANYADMEFHCTAHALQELDIGENRSPSFHISSGYSARLGQIRREKDALEIKIRGCANVDVIAGLLEKRDELTAQEREEENAVLSRLSQKLEPFKGAMLKNIRLLCQLDLAIQKAKLAIRYGCCKPRINTEAIIFNRMVNPLVVNQLSHENRSFTPLSITLSTGTTVITGANMGGKSVALKTIALNTLLVHCGFYPFAEFAACPIFRHIHLVNEDLADADRGLSSFGGEVDRLKQVARHMKDGLTLALFDELARGANPGEGAAIVRGVAEYMNESGSIAVITTHYDGVAACACSHYRVAGLKGDGLSALSEQIKNAEESQRLALLASYMDYGLVPAPRESDPPQDAINICRLMGLDNEILERILKHR